MPSMPGRSRDSLNFLREEVTAVYCLGIGAIALLPLIPPEQKDNAGTESDNPDGFAMSKPRSHQCRNGNGTIGDYEFAVGSEHCPGSTGTVFRGHDSPRPSKN